MSAHDDAKDEKASVEAVEPESMHPHLHPHPGPDVCERCGSDHKVHKGLCHRCREILRGEGKPIEPAATVAPHQAQPEPLHSPPWRRRGA